MSYLLMALAVFWTLRFIRLYIDGPEWAWYLVTLVLSMATVLLWLEARLWYVAFAIAGAQSLLAHLEDLLITKADEARVNVMRPRRNQ